MEEDELKILRMNLSPNLEKHEVVHLFIGIRSPDIIFALSLANVPYDLVVVNTSKPLPSLEEQLLAIICPRDFTDLKFFDYSSPKKERSYEIDRSPWKINKNSQAYHQRNLIQKIGHPYRRAGLR
jgi:hypothetical protein